ncbi:MAG TPA: cytochrome c [Chitinophagaceae bacterium]|nr:cytochrome c [Chitinophagaceae bacterium]
MIKKISFSCVAFLVFVTAGCYYDKEELLYPGGSNCQTAASKFSNVSPIIQSRCAFSASCHGAGSTNAGGPLTSYDLIKNKAAGIKHQVQTGLMPQTGSLSATELQSIVCWVEAGAPNN